MPAPEPDSDPPGPLHHTHSYHAMIELRPHRQARSPDEAASALEAEVVAGRLDGDAVDAVLRAAGHQVRWRRVFPAGLTTREVEVMTDVPAPGRDKTGREG